ncbi:MAG: holo-[acyl-carrier-protein] synthase [Anaerolineaceae bacterium]|jgi:holo-[acyl-carrier protein] synthase|nr:holo-[acyl-carrier-protein] synthase [Anaerolineae bacterium]MBL1171292.1 holo-[acyl-carrier-protein] synthase [Chloroflexota bacterium]MBV6466567.1 Holo-[acyl-carrier-protein] synthase [Anaerolineales bacterium]MCE7906667.1 holo-[acyl-carrier-protein] synthase [Anaerolineae bacterium CFX3]MDL1926407.1 holo-[acyl-carrier-protein] synthase [Anaerolineae bacterium AMX1]OQY85427.1 MAG: holo-[acyl-carrier-protein] synthase [Anaerolineae bacterium UTCFX3]GJQ40372.1 MAG: holo-[acyl-carrier-prote
MKLATGIDLLEIERLRGAIETHGEKFLRRIFTARELDADQDKLASLAGRFAAKEAAAKALGCGIGDVAWKEIEILRAESGAPQLVLHGAAERLAREQGVTNWSLSISHSQSHAVAMVVGTG